MNRILITLIGSAAFLSGCATPLVESIAVESGLNEGVLYAIPQQALQFSASRTCITQGSLEKAVTDAENAVEEARAALQSETSNYEALKARLSEHGNVLPEAAGARTRALESLQLEIELAKLAIAVENRNLSSAQQSLAAAREARDAGNSNSTRFEYAFALKALEPIPSDQRFVAQLHTRAHNSADFEITTTSSGLLSGGTSTARGELDDVFLSIVSAFANLHGALRTAPSRLAGHSEREARCTEDDNLAYSQIFHATDSCLNETIENGMSIAGFTGHSIGIPSQSEDLSQVRGSLESSSSQAASDGNDVIGSAAVAAPCRPNESTTQVDSIDSGFQCSKGECNGLLYPRTVPFRITIRIDDYLVGDVTTPVIDRTVLGLIPIMQRRFADNSFEYEFSNGLLTRYKVVDGNELTGFLGMFPAAARAIISIPTEILQLKINYSSAEEGYYEARQAAIAARLALENAQTVEP